MKKRLFGLVDVVAAAGALGWIQMSDIGDNLA